MLEYSTGNATVDAMASIQFTGNIIPQIWYKQIVRDNGKPHLLAISILADIVYWYRPTEIRDQETGSFLCFKKKFNGDLLQRSYQQFADMFGESKRTVTDAIIRLESLGVIKRIFRTIEIKGMLYNNVLFIQLNTDMVKKITYPETQNDKMVKEIPEAEEQVKEIQQIPLSQNNEIGVTQKRDRGHKIKGEVSQNFVTRNTKNTKENTDNIILSSSMIKDSKNNSPPTEDEESIKEILNYGQVVKDCPKALVDAVFKEIRNLDNDLIQIDAEMFMKICENINAFSTDMVNSSAYIRTCIKNLLIAKRLSEERTNTMQAKKNTDKNKFNHFQQNDYDFEALEKELLSN